MGIAGHRDENQLGEERVHFSLQTRGHPSEKPGQDLKQEPGDYSAPDRLMQTLPRASLGDKGQCSFGDHLERGGCWLHAKDIA